MLGSMRPGLDYSTPEDSSSVPSLTCDGFVSYDGIGAISRAETTQASAPFRSLTGLLSNEPEIVAAYA